MTLGAPRFAVPRPAPRPAPKYLREEFFAETPPLLFWEGVDWEWRQEKLLLAFWKTGKHLGLTQSKGTGMQHLAPPGGVALTQWGPRACVQTARAAERSPAPSQLTPGLHLGV